MDTTYKTYEKNYAGNEEVCIMCGDDIGCAHSWSVSNCVCGKCMEDDYNKLVARSDETRALAMGVEL